MVASSVVSTILILNYHHRNADTHEMSEWVSCKQVNPPNNHSKQPQQPKNYLQPTNQPTNQQKNIKIRNNCNSDHHSSFIASASFQWPQNTSSRGTFHILPHISLYPYIFLPTESSVLSGLRPLSHRISIFLYDLSLQKRKRAVLR